MAKKSVLRDKSYAFAVRMVKFYQFLRNEKSEFVLSKQILRSGTSIGANIEEASGTQSCKDFTAKLHIALKEARETHYWIRLLHDTDFISSEQCDDLLKDAEEIIALLTASLKTIKANDTKANAS
ncbi:MAG: four helix bundle protein [Bacteroidales bacterium]|nr:four helix bundle protein [Bacteroidales bacterium]